MKFLNNHSPSYDLTYNDVFLVPNYNNIPSRLDVDLTTPDKIGTNIPIVVANMSAVAGRRMAETVARRGGVTVLPQDIPLDVLEEMVRYIKSRNLVFDTPLTLKIEDRVIDALNIIHKRSHGAVVIINDKNEPIGFFTEKDATGYDRFTLLKDVINKEVLTVRDDLKPEQIYNYLYSNKVSTAPVVKNGKLVGIITQKGALRSELYIPAVDKKGELLTAAAIGINGNVKLKTEQLLKIGVDIIVLDTAH
ncbi:MAG: IMP dehydrogenase, partial [Candidatus Saccharimonadales bacterium]